MARFFIFLSLRFASATAASIRFPSLFVPSCVFFPFTPPIHMMRKMQVSSRGRHPRYLQYLQLGRCIPSYLKSQSTIDTLRYHCNTVIILSGLPEAELAKFSAGWIFLLLQVYGAGPFRVPLIYMHMYVRERPPRCAYGETFRVHCGSISEWGHSAFRPHTQPNGICTGIAKARAITVLSSKDGWGLGANRVDNSFRR